MDHHPAYDPPSTPRENITYASVHKEHDSKLSQLRSEHEELRMSIEARTDRLREVENLITALEQVAELVGAHLAPAQAEGFPMGSSIPHHDRLGG